MPNELGAWLRQERQARGLSRPELARRMIEAADARGDTSVPALDSVCHNIYRWERGEDGISERYKLYCCQVLGIPPGHFGSARPDTDLADQALLPHAAVAYRGGYEPGMGDSAIRQEVLMAAHRGSEHAQGAEEHGIGESTYDQLRADLVRLSGLTDTGEPFVVFQDMRRVRERIYRLLERRLWPREQTDLYFFVGCLNGLMGIEANRLGYPDSAEELIRAGWAYASAIDHHPLMGSLRDQHAHVAYQRGRFSDSRDLAASGLHYLAAGPMAALLHFKRAQACASLGDVDSARHAVAAAHEARGHDYTDDLLQIGGEFAASLATHHCFAGAALASTGTADHEAAQEIERAVSLYGKAGPEPGEQHWFGGRPLAGIDLAVIRLRTGALDAATAALEPVLTLPPPQRITDLTARLTRVRAELAAPVFRGSAQAAELGERIEEFDREAVTAGLHTLSGGPR